MDQTPSNGSNCASHQYSVRFGPGPERALGLARVWTAVGILLLVCLHPDSPSFPINRAVLFALAFAIYSFILFWWFRGFRQWPERTVFWLHSGDVAWAVLFPLVFSEPRVFILAFLFAQTAAAQRWSFSRLLETSGAIAAMVSLGLLAEYEATGANSRILIRNTSNPYFFWGIFALFAGGLIWFLTRREAARRWEAAAQSAQRAHSRVAVELHDSIVQSLFTAECYIERIRSNAEELPPAVADDLNSLQDLVHKTSMKLRDIVWQERPLDLGTKSFVDYMTALIAEFEQDTGIAVHFDWNCGKISPPPSSASELVRILQEALLNVRKHSGARHVTISFGLTRNDLRFRIDDDGQGFDFSGRLGMLELEHTAQGPFVIRERVSALGGNLAVVSTPGSGARLEIALPKDAFV
jgi:signal transduction histidine kinase